MTTRTHELTNETVATNDARDRIADAAARCIIRDGVAASTMAVIASDAGVSKALLHYHFADRTQLLAAAVDRLGHRIIARETTARQVRHDESAIDALWRWLESELRRGEICALLTLSTMHDEKVRAAAARTALARRDSMDATVAVLFKQLGLRPRVPMTLVAGASLAFINGLALSPEGAVDARVSFDVLWLALLTLAD